MEPILIATDAAYTDTTAIRSFDLDLAYGTDEQDFEAAFESPVLNGGELLYIDGTAYGGVVDVIESDTESTVTVYRGRTWHGILSGKIIAPAYNQDYVQVSGDANECISTILSRVALTDIMAASSETSGITITNYRFKRFVNAYDGLAQMLAASGAKLMMEHRSGKTVLWAEPISTIEGEADSDLMQFVLSANHRVPNHLVCAGEGELSQRIRLDLYADAQGNISTTQTFFGVDEIAVFYDYTGADLDTLREDGTKTLKEMQVQGNVEADVAGVGDWDVGDVLVARDNRLGRSISAQIVKKIVRVSRGELTTEYEVGLPTATTSRLNPISEGAGASVVYTAGAGIQIASGVISADVTQSELDAVASTANSAVQVVSGAAPITATKSGTTYTVGHALSGVVADRYGPNANLAPAFGDTVTIPPQISMDQEGHITQANARTLTIPATTATQSAAGLMSAADKIKLDAGIGDALTKEEADTYYQPIGDYQPAGDYATSAELEEATATASTTVNLTNLGSGTHTLRLYRQGHFVYASMTSNVNASSTNTNINTGTVPSGYRPVQTHFQRGNCYLNNAVSGNFRWYVNTSGNVMFTTSVTGARESQLSMVWWTADAMPS